MGEWVRCTAQGFEMKNTRTWSYREQYGTPKCRINWQIVSIASSRLLIAARRIARGAGSHVNLQPKSQLCPKVSHLLICTSPTPTSTYHNASQSPGEPA